MGEILVWFSELKALIHHKYIRKTYKKQDCVLNFLLSLSLSNILYIRYLNGNEKMNFIKVISHYSHLTKSILRSFSEGGFNQSWHGLCIKLSRSKKVVPRKGTP